MGWGGLGGNTSYIRIGDWLGWHEDWYGVDGPRDGGIAKVELAVVMTDHALVSERVALRGTESAYSEETGANIACKFESPCVVGMGAKGVGGSTHGCTYWITAGAKT